MIRLAECVKTSDCERPECKCVRCVKCTAAQVPTCNILRDRIVQETYYPDLSSTYTAKCEIIDQLANRLSGEIFGNGRTFRDTAQCRDIVMQVSGHWYKMIVCMYMYTIHRVKNATYEHGDRQTFRCVSVFMLRLFPLPVVQNQPHTRSHILLKMRRR